MTCVNVGRESKASKCLRFLKTFEYISYITSSSLPDVDDIQQREAKRNYGHTSDPAYFEDALCGQEGPRARKGEGRIAKRKKWGVAFGD